MATEIALRDLEESLEQIAPRMVGIMPPEANLPVERIIRTLIVSCERNPKLLECTRQSLISGAWTAAVLALEVDGVTGQGYLIPYNNHGTLEAQFQIGFKGHGTIAGRSGFLLHGGRILEGDEHSLKGLAQGIIEHEPTPGHRDTRRMLWTYATLTSLRFPPIAVVLDIDEIEAIRKVSKQGHVWSQWYGEMCIKSAKKRLAKSCPLNLLHLAGALDDQVTIGKRAVLRGEGVLVVEGEPTYPKPQPQPDKRLTLAEGQYPVKQVKGADKVFKTADEWAAYILTGIQSINDAKRLQEFLDRNAGYIDAVSERDLDTAAGVCAEIERRIKSLGGIGA